jgi:glycosyltransferase involved in cell wall biosynthesis
MIYIVVQDFLQDSGIINGGSQSAKNLLLGLKNLQLEFKVISWSWIKSSRNVESRITLQETECQFGQLISLGLPTIQEWKDFELVVFFKQVLRKLPETTGIFHLLEVKDYLGSWLAALESTDFKVVVTALDYAWLCANSHLLTRTSEQCSGPKSAMSCLECHYNHKDLAKKVALKLLLASTALSPAVHKLYPPQLNSIAQIAVRKKRTTETRFANLSQDFQQIDALIAPSKILKSFFAKNGLSDEKIFHVPYGTQPGKKIEKSERPSEGIVFGFVGKLTFDKGLDILIEALSQVRGEIYQNIYLVVYSSEDNSGFGKQMQQKIHALSWITQSRFNGRDPQSIDEAHRKIHFQVAPSRWTDNLPNAVLEGIERHTPIIAPRYGSFLEMVEEGVSGWFYDNNTVRDLKELLVKIVKNPERYAQLPFDDRKTRLPRVEAEDIVRIYQKLLPSL